MSITKPIMLEDLNGVLTCSLCSGYFVDATTLVDCMHSFCKSCILKHFENNKMICPTCNTICKRKRQDMQLQTLVYKIVPGLYSREIQRREDFYRTADVRASSSCSDDSVIGDNMQEHEEWIHTIDDENQFLSGDDSISLSLEYYQQHLDTTSTQKTSPPPTNNCKLEESAKDIKKDDKTQNISTENSAKTDNKCSDDSDKKDSNDSDVNKVQNESDCKSGVVNKEDNSKIRRYLQCPAAVSMTHLQKFIRMKYALSSEHKVDIIHCGEVLSSNFTLMDVAYTFGWRRQQPMRFFYRIFTPMKIRPIRIINTSSTGQKQLQIVQVNTHQPPPETPRKPSPTKEIVAKIESEENSKEKERLMAELQLQSKAKLAEQAENLEKNQNSRYGKTYERIHEIHNVTIGEKRKRDVILDNDKVVVNEKRKKLDNDQISSKLDKKKRDTDTTATCIFDYEENEKEELKRFAEKRDREWQMIKHPEDEHREHKKRKKNKHSKDFQHKKRKMHAEITSELSNKQESIKLKVKLTPHNGHKHKHHKSQTDGGTELSSKEKLRQMRQVRHKIINNEDKAKEEDGKGEFTITLAKTTTETQTRSNEVKMKSSETQTKSSETQTMPKDENKEKTEPVFSGKTLRSDFTIKTTASKEISNKQATVQIDKNEQVEKQVQKSFPRLPYPRQEKPKVDSKPEKKIAQNTKSLQQQISRLQQQCSVKSKVSLDQQPKGKSEKPRILNTQYPPGFTVSKVEAGVKKKVENNDQNQDKRPSLEITLINPTTVTTTPTTSSTISAPKQSPTITTKKPLPATIPLERIKSIKGITTLSGISIIPKVSEKCDNIGALDLSKPHKPEPKIELNKNGLNPTGNGLKPIPNTPQTTDKGPLSNLQMLSKVATEHPNINKPINVQNKPRQQIPNLQNIKVPNLTQPKQPPNLAKMPNLKEIKGQFRMTNSPRTVRPNQNQNIRNIPNPSLLVRQQNQNRMNSLGLAQTPGENKDGKSGETPSPSVGKKVDEEKKVEKSAAESKT